MKLFLLLFLFLTVAEVSSQNKKIPVTCNSSKVLSFYNQAMTALFNADYATSIDFHKKILREDPNFFLSQYHLADISWFAKRLDEYHKYAEMAKNNKSKLSEAELLFKSTLETRETDPQSDNLAVWKKLADMYPQDPEPYYYWAKSLFNRGKLSEAIEVLKNTLGFSEQPAPVFNMLGYTYLSLKNFINAEKSFDKYIQLEPDRPNPYDSKGDYYMEIKDYANAYDSYMSAYDRNANWSYDKAQKAKKLMGTTLSGIIDSTNLQGSWQLAGGWLVNNNGKRTLYRAGDLFNQIKVWSGNQFICVGKYKDGDKYLNNFACGTFSLDGRKYTEDIKYHANSEVVGQLINMSMEIKGDTLIQIWPTDDMGKVDIGKSTCEKYIRVK